MIARLIAKILARPTVTDWLIRRATRTPFTHIYGADGSLYMERYWLFNPYPESSAQRRRWQFPISIRLHRIVRPDADRALHDHPWNARTFILRGWYAEFREGDLFHVRMRGDTVRLRYGEYHRITHVNEGGTWTLFVTGKYRGTWGFKVDGKKVPWRTYLGIER